MKAATERLVSMSGLRAARAVAAAWVILALGGTGLEAQGVAPPGLVSWWRAEGNAADAQAANPGALVGPVAFVPGRVGQAFRLAGNSYIEVASSTTLETQAVTVAAWVRGVAPGAGRYILSKGAPDCVAASYALYTGETGELYFYTGNGNSLFRSASAGTAVWDGQWHFVVGTFHDDFATVRLYVDGVEVGTAQPTLLPIGYDLLTNDKLYIGAYPGSCNPGFTGDIDEVQVYDRALDASQILSLFQGASVSFTSLAGTGTAVPGAAGFFTSFPQSPAISGGVAAFLGLGSAGSQGIYLGDVSVPPNPVRVADGTTAIPQGVGTFTGFSEISVSDVATPVPPPIRIGFIGSGVSQQGVYLSQFTDVFGPSPPPIKVANLATAIPGGAGSFTAFSELVISDVAFPTPPPIRVGFIGSGVSQQGIYLSELANVSLPGPPPIKVADLTTAIPGGAGNFTGFSALTTGLGHTAFLGQGSFGQAGIYLASTLTKLIAVGDQLAGKTVAALRLGRFGLDGHTLSFTPASQTDPKRCSLPA